MAETDEDCVRLSETESWLVACIENADICDFKQREPKGPKDRAPIRADRLRRILLGLPVFVAGETEPRAIKIYGPGVRIHWAEIIGELNLEDGRAASGGPLPSLSLTECLIPSAVKLSRAHFNHLNLRNSQLVHLCGADLKLDGPLDVRGVSTAELPGRESGAGGNGLCWIELQRAHIAGSVEGDGATLSAPPVREYRIPGVTPSNYALNFLDVHIRDSVFIEMGFSAYGGVNLDGAEVGGTLFMRGAQLTRSEGVALNMVFAQLRGSLIAVPLNQADSTETLRFHAIGDVCLDSAVISGIHMDAARIDGALSAARVRINGKVSLSYQFTAPEVESLAPPPSEVAGYPHPEEVLEDVHPDAAEIDDAGERAIVMAWLAQANLRRFECSGPVYFSSARVTEDFDAKAAEIGDAFDLSGATIDGNLTLNAVLDPQRLAFAGFTAKSISLHSARLERDAYFQGVRCEEAFNCESLKTGGALVMWAFEDNLINKYAPEILPLKSHFAGGLHCLDAEIGGTLDLAGARIGQRLNLNRGAIRGDLNLRGVNEFSDDAEPLAPLKVLAANASILGNILLEDSKLEYVRLSGGKIMGDLKAQRARIGADTPKGEATPSGSGDLIAFNAEINGDVYLIDVQIFGELQFEGSNIGHNFYLQPLRAGGKFNFRSIRVEKEFVVDFLKLPTTDSVGVLLANAHVGRLIDGGGADFGSAALELDNFDYGAFEIVTGEPATEPPLFPWILPHVISRGRRALTVPQRLIRLTPRWIWPALLAVALAAALVSVFYVELRPWRNVFWGLSVASYFIWAFYNFELGVSAWRLRKAWLARQFSADRVQAETYRPGVYERVIRQFRAEGLFEDARRLASYKLTLETELKTPVFLRPLMWVFGGLFDYGLSPRRAILTFAAVIAIGICGVTIADNGIDLRATPLALVSKPLAAEGYVLADLKPSLVVSTNSVNSVVLRDEHGRLQAGLALATQATSEELPCGEQIEPWIYAIDIFVPAIDLHQESQCMVSTRPDAAPWRAAKALYAMIGWLITSLTILTVSGILRRQVEP